jgi:glycosyltransferase involved in cell wall biosynthesis
MQDVIAKSVDQDTRSRIRIIPNWADKTVIVPIDRAVHPLFDELGVRDRFVVQYSGNIGRFHEIETILDAATRLDDGAFSFVFYGEGKQVEQVRRAVAEAHNGAVCLMPFQPRVRLGLTLTSCDASLVTLKEGLSGLATPSKLYGVLAAGRPVVVVGPEDCEAARVVLEAQCGVVVRPGDGAELAQALRRLRDDPALCTEYGLRARRAFEERYDLQDVARLWAALCKNVAETTKNKSRKAFE